MPNSEKQAHDERRCRRHVKEGEDSKSGEREPSQLSDPSKSDQAGERTEETNKERLWMVALTHPWRIQPRHLEDRTLSV